MHVEKGARKEQSGGEEAVQIDPREAVCAFLLFVGFGCLFVSRTGPHFQGKERLQWVAIAMLTASLVPLAVPGSNKRTPAYGKPTCKRNTCVLYSQRSKLYKLRGDAWEELGVGVAKFVMCTATGTVRFTARSEVTGVRMANHLVVQEPPCCSPKPSVHSAFCSVWCAWDVAGAAERVIFAIKFTSPAAARAFEASFASFAKAKHGSGATSVQDREVRG